MNICYQELQLCPRQGVSGNQGAFGDTGNRFGFPKRTCEIRGYPAGRQDARLYFPVFEGRRHIPVVLFLLKHFFQAVGQIGLLQDEDVRVPAEFLEILSPAVFFAFEDVPAHQVETAGVQLRYPARANLVWHGLVQVGGSAFSGYPSGLVRAAVTDRPDFLGNPDAP